MNKADNEDVTSHVFNLSPARNLAEMSIFFDGLRIELTCHSRSTMSLRTMVTGVVGLNITSRPTYRRYKQLLFATTELCSALLWSSPNYATVVRWKYRNPSIIVGSITERFTNSYKY